MLFSLISTIVPIGDDTAFAASSVNKKNCKKDIDKSWCYRLDGPHYNGDVYHVHIYKKSTHYYCFKLSDLSECDSHKNKVHKMKDLPSGVSEKIMKDKSVQDRAKQYNKSAQSWADKIPKWALVSAASVLVALATITVFFPGDDVFAWGVLLRALA